MKRHLLFLVIISSLLSVSVAKTSVEFQKDGCFYIYLTINDSIQGRFIFDTGASGLYLDSAFLKKHPSIIKTDLDSARMRGAGATKYKQVCIVKDIVKINAGDYNYNFSCSPILKLSDINGEDIAGIIGNEFVKNQILIIDNDSLILRIDTVIEKDKYELSIPFQYIQGRIYLPVELFFNHDQHVTARLLVDLGCSDAVILNNHYYNSLKNSGCLPQKVVDYTILYGGALGGNSSGGEFRIFSIMMGDNQITEPIISFSKDTLGSFSSTDYDGLLGNEILNRYNFAIDYSSKKLYLSKNKTFHNSFRSSLSGFYALKEREFATVMSVYYQSDAYQKGVRLGDVIIEINGKKVGDLSVDDFNNELKGEGKQVKVVVVREGKYVGISFLLRYLL